MSILIKNGLVYDGRGQPPFKRDILIRGKYIAGVGTFSKRRADTVIDAEDALVLPGFVDINSASDHYLNILTEPHQTRFIEQGITTILGGNEGSSLAPLLDQSLASIHKWGGSNAPYVNTDWHSFKGFLKILQKRGVGVNFGSLVGYATIKRAITGNEPRDLTEAEISLVEKTVRTAFKEGAFGVSTGFSHAFGRNTTQHEAITLATIAAHAKRVYATTLRNPVEDVAASYKEIEDIIERSGANVEINHVQPFSSEIQAYQTLQKNIEQNSHNKYINIDCHPYPLIKLPIYKLLPDWMQRDGFESMQRIIRDSSTEKNIIEHLKSAAHKTVRIAHVPRHINFLKGKTIKALSQKFNLSQAETIFHVMKLSSLEAVCLHETISEEQLHALLSSRISLIASNGLHLASSEYRPFIEFLRWAVKESKISLEDAVAKCTARPATKYGIVKRGIIKENYFADIIVLRDMNVHDVIINGTIAQISEQSRTTLGGMILMRT